MKRNESIRGIPVPRWSVVLGFSEPKTADWGRVRAAQLDIVRRLSPARFAASLFGLVCIVTTLRGSAPYWMLLSWAGILLGAIVPIALAGLRQPRPHVQSASQAALYHETLMAAPLAIAWAAAPLLFGRYADTADLLMIWAICLAMITAAAFGMAALPLASAFFLMTVGLSLALSMYLLGFGWIALVAITFTVGLVVACLYAARTFIIHESSELQLAEKNEVVSLLLREFDDSGGDWMWRIDAAKCLTHVSPRFAYALGVEPESLEGKPLLQILAGDAWEAGNFSAGLRELAEKLKKREAFSELILPVAVGTESHWWELSASPRYDDNQTFLGFRGVGKDVTAQRRSADKINHMARFDTLTGLPNRLSVNEALGTAMAEADRWRTKCAFMMIDLDRFKAVNDTLGHPVGDRLLTRVAERLRSIVTGKDTCGRLGGDEFGFVVADASDTNRLSRLARQIIDTLSQPYEIDQHTLYIGASVGTAVGPRDGRTAEMLIRSADLALYRSKDQGGGSVNAYEPQLHVHAEERRILEIALRKALERNELQVHYQPIVALENGRIEGFEALLRWTNPELGEVSPARFVPVAEDARLIGPMGEWVLRTACQEALRWPAGIRLAVNISPEQLIQPGFVTSIVSALSHSRLPAHRLELEVTESVFMRECTGIIATLDQIVSLGVRVVLDDFGTGQSSLGHISKAKFSAIKIDRSLVVSAAKDLREARATICAVVAMADCLGITTTGEGIETEAELAVVTKLGCHTVQGFLFGRPMPAPEARKLFDVDRAVA